MRIGSNRRKLHVWTFLMLASSLALVAAGAVAATTAKAAAPPSRRPPPISAACDPQKFEQAEARFMQLSALEDASLPASAELRLSAAAYIAEAEKCYEASQGSGLRAGQDDPEQPIDDGGVWASGAVSPTFAFVGTKWGSGSPFVTPPSTAGGTVTYSYMPNGVSLAADATAGAGASVAIQSLPGYQACFLTDINTAVAAWAAVANIQFTQVADNGLAMDAAGAQGNIRIGAHTFDGASNVLAHAYYPPPNGGSAAGDVHFDRQENWTCDTTGIDIGIVALHELGHSIGLAHQSAAILAVMNPIYNPGLQSLQPDDVTGAAAIYGPAPTTSLTISGNAGIAGATLGYNNGGPQTAVADGTGAYSFSVPYGWSGTVTPSKTTYRFTPPNKTYVPLTVDQLSQNYSAARTPETIGLASGGWYFLRNANTSGAADLTFTFGWAGPTQLVGDWDGDGVTSVGLDDNGWFFLTNSNHAGVADVIYQYGWAGAMPLMGDWDGNGTTTPGLYSNGWFFLRNSNTPGPADLMFSFGWPGANALVGDWDGNGTDTIGIHSGNTFHLRNTNTPGPADVTVGFGWAGPKPIVGDWDGNGTSTIGMYTGGMFYLRNTNAPGPADLTFSYGWEGATPLAGRWIE